MSLPTPVYFQIISYRGACGKSQVLPHNVGRSQNLPERNSEMRVLWSTYGSRRDIEPRVGLGMRLRTLGVESEECDALAATSVMPAGVWR